MTLPYDRPGDGHPLALSPTEVDRLFRPFRWLDGRRASHNNGHGLGSSIVRADAATHGAIVAGAGPGGTLISSCFSDTGVPRGGADRFTNILCDCNSEIEVRSPSSHNLKVLRTNHIPWECVPPMEVQ